MNKVFIGNVNTETGTLTIQDEMGTAILTLEADGTLTLYGPKGVVIRTYSEAEVDTRQGEIDAELVRLYDEAYEPGFGERVLYTFTAVGQALEDMFNSSLLPEHASTPVLKH